MTWWSIHQDGPCQFKPSRLFRALKPQFRYPLVWNIWVEAPGPDNSENTELEGSCVVSSLKVLGLRLDAMENELRDEGSCQGGWRMELMNTLNFRPYVDLFGTSNKIHELLDVTGD